MYAEYTASTFVTTRSVKFKASLVKTLLWMSILPLTLRKFVLRVRPGRGRPPIRNEHLLRQKILCTDVVWWYWSFRLSILWRKMSAPASASAATLRAFVSVVLSVGVMPISSVVAMPTLPYQSCDGRHADWPWHDRLSPATHPSGVLLKSKPPLPPPPSRPLTRRRSLIDGGATDDDGDEEVPNCVRTGPDLTRSQSNNRVGPIDGVWSCQPTSDQSTPPLITCPSVRRPCWAAALIFNIEASTSHVLLVSVSRRVLIK